MMFMDPLLFVLGLVFIGMMVFRLLRRELAWRHLWRIAVVPILGFLLVHVAMRLAVGFDILSVFVTMMRAAADFNQRAGRPYGVWVVQNLKEFLLGAGVIPSLVFVVTMTALAGAAWRAGRAAGLTSAVQALFASPAAALATSVCLCLLRRRSAGRQSRRGDAALDFSRGLSSDRVRGVDRHPLRRRHRIVDARRGVRPDDRDGDDGGLPDLLSPAGGRLMSRPRNPG